MSHPIAVLLVADDELAARRLRSMLKTPSGPPWRVNRTTSADGAAALLGEPYGACVVMLRPNAAGGELRFARAAARALPLIVASDEDDRRVYLEAMALGAGDFVAGTSLTGEGLRLAVLRAIEHHRLDREPEQSPPEDPGVEDRFVSHAAEDLRTPVADIRRLVAQLRDGLAGDLNTEQGLYLEKALRNAHRLDGMIDALLEVVRAESGTLIISSHPIDVTAACLRVIESFDAEARARRVEISGAFEEDLPAANADGYRVRQVLEQLVGNALKFCGDGGEITVRARLHDGGKVQIDVSDTGTGIDPEARAHIFDRLYRESGLEDHGRAGLGLGLFLCREIVRRLGGEIWVTSTRGAGSTFSFTLPVTAAGVQPRPSGG